MKKDTHPEYYNNAKITCACGNSYTTGSTVKEIRVEICSMCHPFYTGKQKLVDDRGRVERFQRMVAKKSNQPKKAKKSASAGKQKKKQAKKDS